MKKLSAAVIEECYKKIKKETEDGGYFLNSDVDFTKELIKGLLINEERYGYWACPCRLASGIKEQDLDIICPCYYRDADVFEFNACFCALYVSEKAYQDKIQVTSIPERRYKTKKIIKENKMEKQENKTIDIPVPIWRCQVCGYLCGKEFPPEICPICKARKERFEKFIY